MVKVLPDSGHTYQRIPKISVSTRAACVRRVVRDRRRDLSSFGAMACENTVCTADFSPDLSLQLVFAVLDKKIAEVWEGISPLL